MEWRGVNRNPVDKDFQLKNIKKKKNQQKIIFFIIFLNQKKNVNCAKKNGKLFKKFHNYHDVLYNKSLSYYFKNYTQNKKTFSQSLRKMINKGEKTNFKEYNSALKKLEILKKK